MYKFACKSIGVDCDFSTSGATKEDVMKSAMEHGGVAHADLMKAMTQEQMAEFAKNLEAAIQPA